MNDTATEPMVYICIQHRVFGRLPVLRNMRRFHIDVTKPLRLFDAVGDIEVLQEFLDSWWSRLNWRVDVYRDLWPEEYTD